MSGESLIATTEPLEQLTVEVLQVPVMLVIGVQSCRCGTKIATSDYSIAMAIAKGGSVKAKCPGCGREYMLSQARVSLVQ